MELQIPWDRLKVSAPIGALALLVSTCSVTPGNVAVREVADQSTVVPVAAAQAEAPALSRLNFTPPPGPPTGDAAPRPTPSPEPVPDTVEVHTPDVVIRNPDGAFDPEVLDDDGLEDLDGIRHFAGASEFTATAVAGDNKQDLTLLAVDPTSFRPLTPEVTAQAPDVWRRLSEGDVVLRHDVAHDLGVELGGNVTLRTDHGTVPVRVGAFASNGAPPLADVLVPRSVATLLGNDQLNVLVVAAGDEPETVGERLASRVGGKLQLIKPPAPQQAAQQPTQGRATSTRLEPFTYTSMGDGMIQIHGDWVRRNIVSFEIPGMGTARCHRLMVPQLLAALREIQEAGLYDHLEPGQYGGCFVPRHILFNPNRSLSMHAWGLAIDFNVRDNAFGARPQMDMRIVRIFEKWGFEWGGWWSTPDGMHFELRRLVPVP